MAQLLRYYTVTDIHAAATLLDPRLKNNATLMTAELRLRAVATLRKLKQQQTMQRQLRAQAKASNNQTNRSSDETDSDDAINEPPEKKTKTSNEDTHRSDFFGDLFAIQEQSEPVDELDAYMNSPVQSITDVATYWCEKDSCWRDFAAAARGLLGVPATSTSSERSFSLAGRTLEERRTQLSSDSVDGLLVLHGLNA